MRHLTCTRDLDCVEYILKLDTEVQHSTSLLRCYNLGTPSSSGFLNSVYSVKPVCSANNKSNSSLAYTDRKISLLTYARTTYLTRFPWGVTHCTALPDKLRTEHETV
jgi:hypothetical protein